MVLKKSLSLKNCQNLGIETPAPAIHMKPTRARSGCGLRICCRPRQVLHKQVTSSLIPFRIVTEEEMSPKRKSAGKKAAATRKRSAAFRKAAAMRKHRAAGRKAAATRKRRTAGRKAAATRAQKKQPAAVPQPAAPETPPTPQEPSATARSSEPETPEM